MSETAEAATIVVESLVARAGRTALAGVSLSWTAGAHADASAGISRRGSQSFIPSFQQ